jgi:hypothetical protein
MDVCRRSVRSRKLLSDEHSTVDGRLIEALAGHKSFQSKQVSDDVLNPPPPDPAAIPPLPSATRACGLPEGNSVRFQREVELIKMSLRERRG